MRFAAHVGVALALALGCTGRIAEPGGDPSDATSATTPGATCRPGDVIDPGATHLRRLTSAEYLRTVRDLFGDVADPTGSFPADAIADGFDNNAEASTVSELHVAQYQAAAERVAAEVAGDAALRERLVGCDVVAEGRACVESFVPRLARLAHRRPASSEEIGALLAIVDATAGDPDPWIGVQLVIEAVLQSPSFLYRPEIGFADGGGDRLRLTGHELATRLAYFLWGTTPDDALLAAADRGELDDDEGAAAVAAGMLDDPRARDGVRRFLTQWVRLPQLDGVTRDPAEHPAFDDALRASMREETVRLLDEYAWSESESFLDVLTARHVWVDSRLASLYGVVAPTDVWASVEAPAELERGGLLTTASVLTLTAKSASGIPIHRGKYVREVLLCETLPPPPPDIPAIPAPIPGESERDRLARHREDPACAGCHSKLDPLGFALARFDAIGARRATDASGAPISAEGSLSGWGAPEFEGALELAATLRGSPAVSRCVATHALRFALGRRETGGDACALAEIGGAFDASGQRLRALLLAIVRSDAFLYRSPPE